MFLLPLICLPFVFILAFNRLIRIPLALWRGELQVPARRRRMLMLAGTAAYLLLLGYTVGLLVALCDAMFIAADTTAAWLHLAWYMAAYPLVYMAAAWIFYYALKGR